MVSIRCGCVSKILLYLESRCSYLVKLFKDWSIRSLLLKNLLRKLLKTGKLGLSLLDDPLEGTKIGDWGTLVQEVDIDVLWDGVLASCDSLEKGGLSTSVLTKKTVSSTVRNFESGVVEKDLSVENEGCRGNLDIPACCEGRKNTSCDSVGDTVLVLLQVHLLEFRVDDLLAIVVKLLTIGIDQLVLTVTIDGRS